MKLKTQNKLFVLLSVLCAVLFALALALPRKAALDVHATDYVDDTGYTTDNYLIVPDAVTNARIDVPTKLDALGDKTNVTATMTVKGVDFTYCANDAWYTNDPYIVFRESADKSYQVWARVTRNGLLQVFTGKIGSEENPVLNVNAWIQHLTQNSSWELKIVSSATSTEFFAGDPETSYGTVTHDEAPLAFGIDFAAGFYGYMTDLSLKIGETEYTDFSDETEIEGFEVSDRWYENKAGGEVPVNVPSALFSDPNNCVKNKTTGEYDKISDLTLELKYTAIDTSASTQQGTHWNDPVVWFWIESSGRWVGVRNGNNNITQIMYDSPGGEGGAVYGGVYHGYEQAPFAYGVTVTMKGGVANVYIGNGSARVLQHANVALSGGTPTLYFGMSPDQTVAFCGISLKVQGGDEYDFSDVKKPNYLNLADVEYENDAKLGEGELFTYNDGTFTYAGKTDANGDVQDDVNNRVKISKAFDDVSLKQSKLKTILSCTITMSEVPASVWLVPGVAFWQCEDGTEYDVRAYYNDAVRVFWYEGDTENGEYFGGNAWGIGSAMTYRVTITIENNEASIVYANPVDGSLLGSAKHELPAGKPIFKIFARGYAATFGDIEMYTKEIDLDITDGLLKHAVAMEAIEAPVAERFGDALTGGKFLVKYSDGTSEEITRENENLTVVAYDENSLSEQTVILRYSDAKSVLEYSKTLTLVDYVTELVIDWDDEDALEFAYGSSLSGYTATAIYASRDEADVTALVTVNGYDATETGEQTVTFTYEGVSSEEFTVTVLADVATGITVTAESSEFEFGALLTGYTVTLNMKSGATSDVTAEVIVSGYDANKAGTQTVTFTYGDFTDTLEVTVKAQPADPVPGEDPTPGEDPDVPGDGSGCVSSVGGGYIGWFGVLLFGIALVRIATAAKRKEND